MVVEAAPSAWANAGAVIPTALIVVGDHWSGALLRAELLERGHDAECSPALRVAIAERRAIGRVFLVAEERLAPADVALLDVLSALYEETRVLLLAHAGADAPPGPWDCVLHRPTTMGEVVQVLATALDGAMPRASRPTARRGIVRRMREPWPTIACERCRIARHYEVPHDSSDLERLAADEAHFVLEHAGCVLSK